MKKQHGQDLTPSEMAEMLEEFVNGHDTEAHRKAFVDHITDRVHRTLQQGIMRYFVALVERWAGLDPGCYDGRNEATVKLAKKIVQATGDKYARHLPLI